MSKKEKIMIGVIIAGLIGLGGVTFKAVQYRNKLIETKKVVAAKEKIIKEKDETILKSVKLGYEALIRYEYMDGARTYSIRHPYNSGISQPDFQVILNKAAEAYSNYNDFLGTLGYRDGKLTKLIDQEKKDFEQISDKKNALLELMREEDEKKK
ncbi:hypothetical protein [Sebaldella sp. S0638]|uniref:hypothetical protein n=1 Tax=Sebaldella sp. S0638 TaxID=2957809 RepID=UPI00209FBCF7|nr:hypothetical protein [Sebaldella sp. S0638]MCP1226183.1 hypothetical protein [Sebaldella sp. S0638]